MCLLFVFQVFDRDNDGRLTVEEMRSVLETMGGKMSPEEVTFTFFKETLLLYFYVYFTFRLVHSFRGHLSCISDRRGDQGRSGLQRVHQL